MYQPGEYGIQIYVHAVILYEINIMVWGFSAIDLLILEHLKKKKNET